MEVGFPFAIDRRGRLVNPDYDEHVREMIELALFTAPGERVNLPDFGCGLLRLIFAPQGDETLAAVAFQTQGQLQRWLGHVIEVRHVSIEPRGENTARVDVRYVLQRDRRERVATFERRGLP